jgi:hypothetical protein
MGKVKDLTGQKFGRLTVVEHIGFTEPNKHGSRYAIWKCKCDCGNYINRSVDVIKRGKSSCGCMQKEVLKMMSDKNITHNMTHTRLYRIYKGMIGRCYYKCSQRYNAYGGRGITVCDEWKNDRTKFFEWALQNGYSDELTIERIDVNGNYCPENCKWIPANEQYKNKQSNSQPLPEPYIPKEEPGWKESMMNHFTKGE